MISRVKRLENLLVPLKKPDMTAHNQVRDDQIAYLLAAILDQLEKANEAEVKTPGVVGTAKVSGL